MLRRYLEYGEVKARTSRAARRGQPVVSVWCQGLETERVVEEGAMRDDTYVTRCVAWFKKPLPEHLQHSYYIFISVCLPACPLESISSFG